MEVENKLQLSLSETVSEPVTRDSEEFSDSCSEELDSSREGPSHGGGEDDEEEEKEERDGSSEEGEGVGNPGWADAMAKVLRTSKPKGKRSVVLSKARRIQDVKVLKEEEDAAVDGDTQAAAATAQPSEAPRKRKRVWENKGRAKPDVLDRNRERTLAKIATKGVVQLFNAVREHQKSLDCRLREAGNSEVRREKVIKSVDKKAFLEVLGGGAKAEAKEEPEAKTEPAWKVLREDFMVGARLKDWDKEEDPEDDDTER